MVTHCVDSQARIMVFPVSIMNDLYYMLVSALVLYLTLVVRSIGRHNYIYRLVHTHPPMHVHTMNLKATSREVVDVRTFRGVKFF